MKRAASLLLVLSVVFSFCACGRLSAGGGSSLDGVTAEITSVETDTKKNGSTVFETLVKITNNSDKPVMKVGYDLTLLDKNGTELHTFSFSYLNVENAIQPGETVFDDKGFQRILDGRPSKMVIKVTYLKDESEIPPIQLPKKGEYLYKSLNDDNLSQIDTKLPSEVYIRIDQGGYEREACLQNADEIEEAVRLFTEITIGNETGEAVTDNYNCVEFTFEDGSTKTVSLNLKSLEVGYHNQYHIYGLDNFDDFWSFANSVVEEVH